MRNVHLFVNLYIVKVKLTDILELWDLNMLLQ